MLADDNTENDSKHKQPTNENHTFTIRNQIQTHSQISLNKNDDVSISQITDQIISKVWLFWIHKINA